MPDLFKGGQLLGGAREEGIELGWGVDVLSKVRTPTPHDALQHLLPLPVRAAVIEHAGLRRHAVREQTLPR